MKVQFSKIKEGWIELSKEVQISLKNTINSGFFVGGKVLEEFEKKFANYTQSHYCVGVSSGLDALTLALKALDIGVDDEVLVPSNTYIASWLAISHCNAKPIPVEPNPKNYNLDIKKIENLITKKNKSNNVSLLIWTCS